MIYIYIYINMYYTLPRLGHICMTHISIYIHKSESSNHHNLSAVLFHAFLTHPALSHNMETAPDDIITLDICEGIDPCSHWGRSWVVVTLMLDPRKFQTFKRTWMLISYTEFKPSGREKIAHRNTKHYHPQQSINFHSLVLLAYQRVSSFDVRQKFVEACPDFIHRTYS